MKGNDCLIMMWWVVVGREVIVGLGGLGVGNGSEVEVRNVGGEGKELVWGVWDRDIGYFECIDG